MKSPIAYGKGKDIIKFVHGIVLIELEIKIET